MSAQLIVQEQQKDTQLLQLLNTNPAYFHKCIERAKLIHYQGKIYAPTSLRMRMLTWYHEMLCHPGQKRLEMTVCQYFTWPGLIPDVKRIINNCYLYKIHKLVLGKYGHLAPKNIDHEHPWHALCVDLIGPYSVTDATGIYYDLLAMTITDPSTG